MGLLSSIELPHWLMIGGAILTAMGFLGLAFARNKEVATNPDSEPPHHANHFGDDRGSRPHNRGNLSDPERFCAS